jgi:hypothetical integral membrane protein (TIGR02206 family)
VTETGFVFFGPSHLAALGLTAGACVSVPFLARDLAVRGRAGLAAWVLVAGIMAYQLASFGWRVGVMRIPWVQDLPLHLCDINAILCAIMLVTRSYRIYEVAYFWALGGSIPALLTPDLPYAFPHVTFLVFFFGHTLVIMSALYATFAYGFRPRLRSVGIALAATALYGALIAPLNFLLGTNYLYLRAKPASGSIMDYFGPWPWYVLALAGLAVVICFLCYAPFAAARARSDQHRSPP